MSEPAPDHAHVIAPPPLIYASGLLVGLGIEQLLPLPFLPRRTARVLGLLLIALSFLLSVPAVLAIRRAHTSLNPAATTTTILTHSSFRYSRNPIYVGFTMLYIGIAALRNTLWPLLFLPEVLVAIRRGVIAREEAYLTRKFGETYTRYQQQVRRWL